MSIRKRYHDLQTVSQEHLGWQWLLPLPTTDEHHLQSLRIPASDEKRDFDDLVLSLAKILIDSLNEEALKKLIPYEKQEALKNKKNIDLLEVILYFNDLEGAEIHIAFLRKLQDHRSSRSPHPKGQSYLKISKDLADILNNASSTLGYFIKLIESGRIQKIFEKNQMAAGYAGFGDMIGIADFGSTDASVNHDDVIYELQSKL